MACAPVIFSSYFIHLSMSMSVLRFRNQVKSNDFLCAVTRVRHALARRRRQRRRFHLLVYIIIHRFCFPAHVSVRQTTEDDEKKAIITRWKSHNHVNCRRLLACLHSKECAQLLTYVHNLILS